ncbi:MAG TPA: ferrochelatase [Elusimicrobiota bacterium]|nr:ferrochelatase [Elusimicrobiota bacterium]
MTTPYDAVLIIGFGGPGRFEDVRPFLENMLHGKPIEPGRYEQIIQHYVEIGGASPYNQISFRQAEQLGQLFEKKGHPLPVYVSFRNWHPTIHDILQRMMKDGIRRSVGFILAPHRSEHSWDRYLTSVEEARALLGPTAPVIDYVDPWHENSAFIDAITERIKESLETVDAVRRHGLAWIFTAHSLPTAIAKKSGYVSQILRTVKLVCHRFIQRTWFLSFQSHSGRPGESWLGPDVNDLIRALAKQGTQNMMIIPIGFTCDHVETLHDLDIKARRVAQGLGVNFIRVKTVGTHPFFIQTMYDVVRKKIKKENPPAHE